MKLIKYILLTMILAMPAYAANKYVRKGATGTGTGADWTNAYTEFSQVTTAGLSGFTIYVAAGSYTGDFPTFNGINNWTMQRATVANHGTDTGWNNAYDGQVTHTGGRFMTLEACSNVTVDGGGTKEPWLFRIVGQNSYDGKLLISGGSNVTIRYIEMDGNGCQPGVAGGPEDGMRILHPTNLIIEHNFLHNFWQCDYGGINTGHSDAIQMPSGDGVVIRYNKFEDSGMLLFVGDCEWGGQVVDNLHIHHNIFLQRAGNLVSNEINYFIICAKGIQSFTNSYFIVENNTFYFVGWVSPNGASAIVEAVPACNPPAANTTRRIIRNNIFAPGAFAMSIVNGTAAYNLSFGGSTLGTNSLSSNPLFVDTAAFNYRLQAGSPAADSGTNTALGYGDTITVDYDGNPIGAARSRGAFEPASTGDPLPAIVSATINAAGTQVAIVFSEAVQVGAGGANGWVLGMSGGSITIPSQTPSGTGTTRTYTFSSVRTVGQGETGSITYTQPGNGIEDSALQDLPNGSSAPVANNSTVPTAAAPSFSPAAGTYFGTQNVTMTSSTSGATVRYTIDGTDPTASSTLYTGAIPTSASTTYKAKAFAATFLDSSISSASYEIGTWVTSGTAWKSFPVTSQTGSFTWSFRASMSQAAGDGVIGLSSILPSGFSDIGPIIQFNTDNTIKARNGANYEAVNAFTYVPGTTYEIACTLNITNRTYSVTAAQISGTPVVIASNYTFRSDSPVAPELDNFGMTALAGTVTVSQMAFGSVTGTIPSLTSATIGSNGTTLTLGFSVPVTYGLGGSGGWTMSSSGGAVTLTPTANPTAFTTSRTIAVGETGTISYTQPGNGVEAVTGGGDLATLTGFAFANQSTSDLTAPTPNPMTFSTPPNATSTSTITMTASLASDVSGVQYYFDEVSGNNGATDSVWQTSRTYTDTGLSPGRQYTYRVIARDTSPAQNQTVPSAPVDVITPIAGGGKVVPPTGTSGAAFVNP